MSPVELVTEDAQLSLLEFTDDDAALPVGRPDHGRVHELQNGSIPECVRDDLCAPAPFEEQPLE